MYVLSTTKLDFKSKFKSTMVQDRLESLNLFFIKQEMASNVDVHFFINGFVNQVHAIIKLLFMYLFEYWTIKSKNWSDIYSYIIIY